MELVSARPLELCGSRAETVRVPSRDPLLHGRRCLVGSLRAILSQRAAQTGNSEPLAPSTLPRPPAATGRGDAGQRIPPRRPKPARRRLQSRAAAPPAVPGGGSPSREAGALPSRRHLLAVALAFAHAGKVPARAGRSPRRDAAWSASFSAPAFSRGSGPAAGAAPPGHGNGIALRPPDGPGPRPPRPPPTPPGPPLTSPAGRRGCGRASRGCISRSSSTGRRPGGRAPPGAPPRPPPPPSSPGGRAGGCQRPLPGQRRRPRRGGAGEAPAAGRARPIKEPGGSGGGGRNCGGETRCRSEYAHRG